MISKKITALLVLIFCNIIAVTGKDLNITTVYEYGLDGSLLAFTERRIGLHDHAQNDIILRRSTDNGQTWLPVQVISDMGKSSLNDPCAVVLQTGRILLMYQRFPYGVHARNAGWIQMGDTGYDGSRDWLNSVAFSDDNGVK